MQAGMLRASRRLHAPASADRSAVTLRPFAPITCRPALVLAFTLSTLGLGGCADSSNGDAPSAVPEKAALDTREGAIRAAGSVWYAASRWARAAAPTRPVAPQGSGGRSTQSCSEAGVVSYDDDRRIIIHATFIPGGKGSRDSYGVPLEPDDPDEIEIWKAVLETTGEEVELSKEQQIYSEQSVVEELQRLSEDYDED